jgi:GNAT superfamily N-acetyltransferase
MHVTCKAEIDAVEYTRFLDGFSASPGAALGYHYPFYVRFLADIVYPGSECRFVVARDNRGSLRGAIPALHVRTAHLNIWLSLAYFGPNAGALVPDNSGDDRSTIVRALLQNAVGDARDRGCQSLTVFTPLNAVPNDYRDALSGPEFELERVAQCLRFPADPKRSPWPTKVRYDVRRAESLGIQVRPIADDGDLRLVWEIYAQNCSTAGVPLKSFGEMAALYRTAGSRGLFLLAEHQGRIVAGLLCLMGGGVLSYYLPCIRPEARPLQCGLLLLDRAVALARADGCRLLNFEASPALDDSVYRFKARCGGVPVPYRVFVKLLVPGVLEKYRTLTPDGLAREMPHAFVVPFGVIQ